MKQETENIRAEMMRIDEEKKTYHIISFERGGFFIEEYEAKDSDEAYKIYEEEYTTNFSNDWILDEEEFARFKEFYKGVLEK